jgi:hypothetical protein
MNFWLQPISNNSIAAIICKPKILHSQDRKL